MRIYVFLLLLILASCTSVQTYNDLIHLRKGMSLQDAEQEFEDRYDESYEISVNGKSYKVIRMLFITSYLKESNPEFGDKYDLNNEQNQLRSKSKKHLLNKTSYYLVFQDDVLLYWGFKYEFKRHKNDEIKDIGTNI